MSNVPVSCTRPVLVWAGTIALALLIVTTCLVGLISPIGFVLTALVLPLSIVLLRRRPLHGWAAILVGITAATTVTGTRGGWYLGDIRVLEMIALHLTVGYLAVRLPRRSSIAAAAVTLAVQLLIFGVFPLHNVTNSVTIASLSMITVWVVGGSIRQRRQYRQQQRAQAELQAVQAERLRIARELHDMIAHSIGVIAIQAGMGRRVIDSQPAEARSALAAIEDTSRETLAGLRRMLGTLRRDDRTVGDTSLDPTPGLDDLDRLVSRSLDAGLHVDVRWLGRRRPLPQDVELSAYRVIQEAVTNVLRHAGVRRCTVVLDQRDDALTVEVADEGRGGDVAPGYGLAGMRERVSLLDGHLDVGPRPEGGFRVVARIPVPAEVR